MFETRIQNFNWVLEKANFHKKPSTHFKSQVSYKKNVCNNIVSYDNTYNDKLYIFFLYHSSQITHTDLTL